MTITDKHDDEYCKEKEITATDIEVYCKKWRLTHFRNMSEEEVNTCVWCT